MGDNGVLGTSRDKRPGFLARLSIAYKVPLLTGALILIVTAAVGTAAYLEVRHTSLTIATDRLQNLSAQLAQLSQVSGSLFVAQTRSAVDSAPMREFMQSSGARGKVAALGVLEHLNNLSPTSLQTELRAPGGDVLLASGGMPSQPSRDSVARRLVLSPMGDSATAGRFESTGNALIFPFAVEVFKPSHAYVVQWRTVRSTPRYQERLGQLLGSRAHLFFGNADGSLWSDLEHIVPPPPVAALPVDSVIRYQRPGAPSPVIAIARSMGSRPWLILVEFPVDEVLAPADLFLKRMIMIAAACVLIGLVAQWLISRRITRPLQQLTHAADAIAAGDYSAPVALDRSDELGSLAASFDAMAGRVRESQQRLEERVAERTQELDATLRQLRDTQAALLRREKLAMLGQLASSVGHELRNPLGVMNNAVYYLDTVLDPAPERVREYLGIIRQQISLSEKIIGDLLDLARTKTPHRVAFTLNELVDAQLRRLPSLNGIRVERAIPDDLPAVCADPVQVGQVVLNLLTNAFQAMDGGSGRLILRGSAPNPSTVCLEVSDTGPGIPHENLDKIFEPLFTTKARGIGLGLAVSQSLVRANGGELRVQSDVGQGATFTLTLPATPPMVLE